MMHGTYKPQQASEAIRPFDVLGIKQDMFLQSDEAGRKSLIKQARAAKGKEYHPDHNGGVDKGMATINNAVSVLEDPEKLEYCTKNQGFYSDQGFQMYQQSQTANRIHAWLDAVMGVGSLFRKRPPQPDVVDTEPEDTSPIASYVPVDERDPEVPVDVKALKNQVQALYGRYHLFQEQGYKAEKERINTAQTILLDDGKRTRRQAERIIRMLDVLADFLPETIGPYTPDEAAYDLICLQNVFSCQPTEGDQDIHSALKEVFDQRPLMRALIQGWMKGQISGCVPLRDVRRALSGDARNQTYDAMQQVYHRYSMAYRLMDTIKANVGAMPPEFFKQQDLLRDACNADIPSRMSRRDCIRFQKMIDEANNKLEMWQAAKESLFDKVVERVDAIMEGRMTIVDEPQTHAHAQQPPRYNAA